MSDFVNPLADPGLTWKGKTIEERAEELVKEQKKRELEAKLAEKRKSKKFSVELEEKASEEDGLNPSMIINNSCFEKNSARWGGVIRSYQGTLDIDKSKNTFIGNKPDDIYDR